MGGGWVGWVGGAELGEPVGVVAAVVEGPGTVVGAEPGVDVELPGLPDTGGELTGPPGPIVVAVPRPTFPTEVGGPVVEGDDVKDAALGARPPIER